MFQLLAFPYFSMTACRCVDQPEFGPAYSKAEQLMHQSVEGIGFSADAWEGRGCRRPVRQGLMT